MNKLMVVMALAGTLLCGCGTDETEAVDAVFDRVLESVRDHNVATFAACGCAKGRPLTSFTPAERSEFFKLFVSELTSEAKLADAMTTLKFAGARMSGNDEIYVKGVLADEQVRAGFAFISNHMGVEFKFRKFGSGWRLCVDEGFDMVEATAAEKAAAHEAVRRYVNSHSGCATPEIAFRTFVDAQRNRNSDDFFRSADIRALGNITDAAALFMTLRAKAMDAAVESLLPDTVSQKSMLRHPKFDLLIDNGPDKVYVRFVAGNDALRKACEANDVFAGKVRLLKTEGGWKLDLNDVVALDRRALKLDNEMADFANAMKLAKKAARVEKFDDVSMGLLNAICDGQEKKKALDAALSAGKAPTLDSRDWVYVPEPNGERHDSDPVLMTANVNLRDVKSATDFDRLIPIAADQGEIWWPDFVVVVRRSGKVDIIRKDEFTLRRLYPGRAAPPAEPPNP